MSLVDIKKFYVIESQLLILWFTGTLHMPPREPTGCDENAGAISQPTHPSIAF